MDTKKTNYPVISDEVNRNSTAIRGLRREAPLLENRETMNIVERKSNERKETY